MTETLSLPSPEDSDTELADAASPDPEWRVGDWTFRPQLHRLSRGDEQVRLEPKVSDLLLFLVERARKPVGKDAIFEGVWEQRFLGDSALTRTMAELRRALGDDARSPSYVETIPKIGYRLIADVRRTPSASSVADAVKVAGRVEEMPLVGAAPDRLARVGVWAVVALLLLALGALLAVPTFRPTIGALPEGLSDPEVTARPKLLAVLPLDDMSQTSFQDSSGDANSADSDHGFFAVGMTEALEARLAQSGEVSIVSSHSVRRLLADEAPLLEHARSVGIDALVEGSVQRSGERVRITVRLTELTGGNPGRDTYSWVETYERDLRDVLALQEEVSRAIADEVRKTLVRPPATVASSYEGPVDPEAYDAYLQARFLLNQRNGKPLEEVALLFDRAAELSPDYAPALSGKARVLAQAAEFGLTVGDLRGDEVWQAALDSAGRALELDPLSTEAHGVMAMSEIVYRWNWREAERHLRQALDTNPSDAWVRQKYAFFLTFLGRFDEAVEQVEEALKLDPLSASSYQAASHVYFHAHRFEQVHETIRTAENRLGELGQSVTGYGKWALALEGRYEEALAAMEPETAESHGHKSPIRLATYGWTLAQSGRRAEALEVRRELRGLDEMKGADPFILAILEAGLGDHDAAFAALERALDERSNSVPYLQVEPFLLSLHDDPRFDQMVARLGL